ncbi:MAG TPA: hypothetical protein VNF74_00680 [Terriglobales bacterium]|nr:hypothetical protein [Terriglobales bacterium]
MPLARIVSLFRNGRNQAVRIPRELELPGREAFIYREGDRLILGPLPPPPLAAVPAQPAPPQEEFPAIPHPPPCRQP